LSLTYLLMNETPLHYPGEALRNWVRQIAGTWLSEDEVRPLEEIANTLFFASLGREEGEITRVSVVYHPQGIDKLHQLREHVFIGGARGTRSAWETIPFEFETSITEFNVKALVKLAPAANLPRTSIVIGLHDGQLVIQGLARRAERTDSPIDGEGNVLVFRAPEPGYLTLSIHGKELFRYELGSTVAPVQRVPLSDLLFSPKSVVRSALMSTCVALINALGEPLISFEGEKEQHISDVIYRLIQRMGAMRHGGLIAILPDSSAIEEARARGKYKFHRESGDLLSRRLQEYVESRASLVNMYWRRPTEGTQRSQDEELDEAITRQDKENDEEELDSLVDNIGQLTAVDNALLLGPNLEVVCAGYPIPNQGERFDVHEARSLQGELGAPYAIGQHGSRHRAASVFAYKHPGGLVFVASQDGPLRCLYRPPGQESVLLWSLRLPDE
jgi:hypothetical protein